MTTVAVPFWLAVLGGLLAAWALYERVMMPSLRWVIRSRANKALDEFGSRLRISIRPFQQTRRQALIDLLAYDAKVQEAVAEHARASGMPRELVTAQAHRYAREIVPAFNAYLYFRLGYWAARRVAESLYRIRIGYVDERRLEGIPADATVVFVMNHRSNMDYVLATYLAADHAALSYAVGEWARIWPLQQLIRAMGAYFVRRNSRDDLYRRVLERYVAMATENGVTQALYPEGRLTRDGRIGEARLGVLDYMLRGFRNDGERDLVFVPLGINYDRTLEDRSLLLALDPDAKRPGRAGAVWNTLRFAANQASLAFHSKWRRFGYAGVNFGAPISMREYSRSRGLELARLPKEERFAHVAALARHLMDAVGALVPVLPVPLIAAVLCDAPGRRFSEIEIKAAVEALAERAERSGARICVPRPDLDEAVDAGLDTLALRRLVVREDGLYRAAPAESALLRYYANSIAHLL
ncbi:MAG TPA: 1-acyl-sn-glycerol-3-phosphate acyltransferase [Burkholderiales bacterium]